jgi:glycosyltransferase involved in cell wall biosynthesis
VNGAVNGAVKVSVIMAVRDAAPVLADALHSLRQQRGVVLELIVVDGASQDETLAVVARFADLAPQVLNGPDQGLYDAMNKGLAVATGEACYFLNADDRLAQPEALAMLAAELSDPAVDLVFGDIVVSGAQGDRWRSHHHVSSAGLGFESLSHQAVLARRSAFERVGGFDLRWRICADLDWFMRCADQGLRFRHVPRLVCRCLAGGLSERAHALHRAELLALRRPRRARHGAQALAAAVRRRLRRLLDPGLA